MQSPSVKKKLIVGVDFGTEKTCKTLFKITHDEYPSFNESHIEYRCVVRFLEPKAI